MRNVPWTEGDVIRKLRQIYDCKLEELAKISGVSLTAINRLELGKTKEPTRETVRKIAAAFGLTPAQFSAAIPSEPIAVPEGKAALRLLVLEHQAQREIPKIPKPARRRRANE